MRLADLQRVTFAEIKPKIPKNPFELAGHLADDFGGAKASPARQDCSYFHMSCSKITLASC